MQAWVEGQTQTAGAAVRIAVQLSLGGAAFGVAVGVVTTTWLRTMFDNRMAEITVTVNPGDPSRPPPPPPHPLPCFLYESPPPRPMLCAAAVQ